MTSAEIEQLSAEISGSRPHSPACEHLASVIVGQQEMLDGLLVALLADGHVPLKGCPAS